MTMTSGHRASQAAGRYACTVIGRCGCPFASTNSKRLSPGARIVPAAAGIAAARTSSAPAKSGLSIVEAHRLAHVAHGLVRQVARLLAAVLDDVAHERGIFLELLGALADGLQLRVDGV